MVAQIVTINIPDQYLGVFEMLIKLGLYNSRSQIIRQSLKEFFKKDQDFSQDLLTYGGRKI